MLQPISKLRRLNIPLQFSTFANAIYFSALIILVFVVYRFGIYDLPRIDHLFFLKEQEFEKSGLDFFLRVISYNRSAYIANGDYFLYRPAFFGYLAVATIFFRENLMLLGCLSLFWHALTVFVLFLLIKRVLGTRLSVILSLIFCFQYSGMEMFIWRHISPYMIGLILFWVGVLLISKNEFKLTHWRDAVLPGLILFGSTLFHESFPLTLFLMAAVSFFSDKKRLALLLAMPALAWVTLNIADYIHYHPESILGTDRSSPFLTLQNSAFNIIFLTGLFFSIFICPFLIRIEYENFYTERGSWDPTVLPLPIIFAVGTVVLIGLVLWIIESVRSIKRSRRESLELPLIGLIYFVVLTMGFGVGRLTVRTTEYLRISTYYYYLSNFCFFLLTACLLSWAKRKYEFKDSLLASALLILGIPYATFNFFQIQKTLSERFEPDKLVAVTVLKIDHELSRLPQYCYGGSFDHSYRSAFSDEVILRESCIKKRGSALYLMPGEFRHHLILSRLNRPTDAITEIPLDPPFMEKNLAMIPQVDPDHEMTGNESAVLSRDEFAPVEISVEIKKLALGGGLVIAYQNERNFVVLFGYKGQLYVLMNRFGIVWSKWYRNKLTGSDEYALLSVRRIQGGRVGIFCNEKIIELFSQGDALNGRIGLFTGENLGIKDVFRNLRVSQVTDTKGTLFSFEPVLEIPAQ